MKHVSVTGQARRSLPRYARFCVFVGALLALLAPARGVAQITWTNHSSPVLGPGPGWESSWVGFVSVIDQDSQYVMWYSGGTNTAGVNLSVGRATSPDGINWTKDALNPVLQHGSSAWDGNSAWVPKVLKIGNAYTMWFTGTPSSDVWQIGRATSTDGRVWVQDSTNPVVRVGAPGQWDAGLVHTGSVLFDGTTYRMWYTGMSHGYGSGSSGIGLATSADGIHWVKDTLDNPVLAAGSAGAWDQHGVGECSVVYDSASQRYLMFYNGNELDYFTAGTSGIGYASSADGIHWNKYYGNPVLPNNQPGSWTSQPSSPFVVLRDSTFHMWYGGTNSNSLGYATAPRVSSIPTAGLQLWLRADAGVDTLNGTVSRWHDQSGNGNDVIQASVSRQPRLVAGRLNGMPVVSFDGVNDKLGFTGSVPMTQFSLFVVLNNHASTPGNEGCVITFGASGGWPHQWFMIMRYPNTPDSIAMGPATDSYVNAYSPNLAAYDQWENLSVVNTGSVFNTTLRWNGNAAHISLNGSDQAISVPLGDATGSGGGIGGADGVPNGTILAKCEVAEMLVYNVALSNSARDSVESYLATKYGLQHSPPTAGLQLWLRADAGVDTLNGKVSRWHDQSGNGNDALQANASRQPSLVPGQLNHLPVVSFDGVNDKLGFTGTTHMTQFSIFLVINNHQGSAAGNGDGHVMTFGGSGDFDHQWFMWMHYPNTPDSIAMATGYTSYVTAFAHNVAAYDQWNHLSIVTSGSVFNTALRSNGVPAPITLNGTDQAISVPLGDATGSGGGIGGADGVPAGNLEAKCDVAEILVYNEALSNSARDSVESYLAIKYGLPTGVADHQGGNQPERFVLEQNYPNPFNPTTVVSFQLPEASNVRLVVYDILGREVSVLVNERRAAGSYSVRFDGHGLSSGVYLYRLQAGNFVQTRKLLLLK